MLSVAGADHIITMDLHASQIQVLLFVVIVVRVDCCSCFDCVGGDPSGNGGVGVRCMFAGRYVNMYYVCCMHVHCTYIGMMINDHVDMLISRASLTSPWTTCMQSRRW